jgi:hypothetical protein
MYLYGNAKRTWIITFMFENFMSLFNKLVLGGMSLCNWQLLLLDGHGNHVTLKAIEQAKEFGLDIITLPSHTSPFKITFRMIKDATMF